MRILLLAIVPIYICLWLFCFGHAIKNKKVIGIFVLFFLNPFAPFIYLAVFRR